MPQCACSYPLCSSVRRALLPGHPLTPEAAAQAFVTWLDAPGAPPHAVLVEGDRERVFTALEQGCVDLVRSLRSQAQDMRTLSGQMQETGWQS